MDKVPRPSRKVMLEGPRTPEEEAHVEAYIEQEKARIKAETIAKGRGNQPLKVGGVRQYYTRHHNQRTNFEEAT